MYLSASSFYEYIIFLYLIIHKFFMGFSYPLILLLGIMIDIIIFISLFFSPHYNWFIWFLHENELDVIHPTVLHSELWMTFAISTWHTQIGSKELRL